MFTLETCESWQMPVQNEFKPNPVMKDLAQKRYCPRAKVWYTIFFIFDICWSCYSVWMTWQLADKLEKYERQANPPNELIVSDPGFWSHVAGAKRFRKEGKTGQAGVKSVVF